MRLQLAWGTAIHCIHCMAAIRAAENCMQRLWRVWEVHLTEQQPVDASINRKLDLARRKRDESISMQCGVKGSRKAWKVVGERTSATGGIRQVDAPKNHPSVWHFVHWIKNVLQQRIAYVCGGVCGTPNCGQWVYICIKYYVTPNLYAILGREHNGSYVLYVLWSQRLLLFAVGYESTWRREDYMTKDYCDREHMESLAMTIALNENIIVI